MRAYLHKDLETEFRTVSGSYSFIEETKIDFGGREVLCSVGVGVIDNSCCGFGGCMFVDVHGYLLSWKCEKDKSGSLISRIAEIEEERKAEISEKLQSLYPYAQIRFQF